MKIFCDTNIVMEFIQDRTHADEVERILQCAINRNDVLCISEGSFYTITYLLDRYLKKEEKLHAAERLKKQREVLNGILDTFLILSGGSKALSEGVNDAMFTDLEDSFQWQVAQSARCEIILTINKKHFKEHGNMLVNTPAEFLLSYC